MSKKICLDLDGIITDIGLQIKKYAEEHSVEFSPIHIGEALLTPDGVDYLEFIFEDPLFWRNLLPIKDSWHAINQWFMANNDIIFITARRSETSISEIEPWLEGWGVMYSDVIICDMGHKYEHIEKIKPIFYVDDNPSEIKEITKRTSIRSYAVKTWYNDHLIGNNILSISNLSELQV